VIDDGFPIITVAVNTKFEDASCAVLFLFFFFRPLLLSPPFAFLLLEFACPLYVLLDVFNGAPPEAGTAKASSCRRRSLACNYMSGNKSLIH